MPQMDFELPANEDAPGLARKAVRELAGTTMSPDDCWRAELIVTELVTNAVLYGPGGPVSVALDLGGNVVHGQVADPGHGIRRRQIVNGRSSGDGGRGLFLVDLLSDGWGLSDGDSRVWFEVAATA